MKTMMTLTMVLALALAGGCGKKDEEKAGGEETAETPKGETKTPETEKPAEPEGPPTMVANLEPKSGSNAKGKVTFEQRGETVTIKVVAEGLQPGLHGFHIHETGDCSAEDASSAGGHFNPEGHEHGKPDAETHHAGDLGNIAAMSDGKAEKAIASESITLGEGPTSVVGKAVIIHEKQDDFTGEAGNAGARVACGVIEVDQEAAKPAE